MQFKTFSSLLLAGAAMLLSPELFAYPLGNTMLTISPSQNSITINPQLSGSVTYTVSNNTTATLTNISIDPNWQAGAPLSGLTISNNTCLSLLPNEFCQFTLTIPGVTQPSSFSVTPKVCSFNGALCSQPDSNNRLQVTIGSSGGPVLVITPSLQLAQISAGHQTVTWTVTNVGDAPTPSPANIKIMPFNLGANMNDPYAITFKVENCQLNPGQSCHFQADIGQNTQPTAVTAEPIIFSIGDVSASTALTLTNNSVLSTSLPSYAIVSSSSNSINIPIIYMGASVGKLTNVHLTNADGSALTGFSASSCTALDYSQGCMITLTALASNVSASPQTIYALAASASGTQPINFNVTVGQYSLTLSNGASSGANVISSEGTGSVIVSYAPQIDPSTISMGSLASPDAITAPNYSLITPSSCVPLGHNQCQITYTASEAASGFQNEIIRAPNATSISYAIYVFN